LAERGGNSKENQIFQAVYYNQLSPPIIELSQESNRRRKKNTVFYQTLEVLDKLWKVGGEGGLRKNAEFIAILHFGEKWTAIRRRCARRGLTMNRPFSEREVA